jgi:hypothetical protein
MQICGIRLSDKTSRLRPRRAAMVSAVCRRRSRKPRSGLDAAPEISPEDRVCMTLRWRKQDSNSRSPGHVELCFRTIPLACEG